VNNLINRVGKGAFWDYVLVVQGAFHTFLQDSFHMYSLSIQTLTTSANVKSH